MFAGDKDTMETQKHIEVTCPGLIKSYNANMGEGGVDKCDMLLALYRNSRRLANGTNE